MKFTFLSYDSTEPSFWAPFWGPILAGVIVSLLTGGIAYFVSFLNSRRKENKLRKSFIKLASNDLQRALLCLSESCLWLRVPEKPTFESIKNLIKIIEHKPVLCDSFSKISLVVRNEDAPDENVTLDLANSDDLNKFKRASELDHFHFRRYLNTDGSKLKEVPFYYVSGNLDKATLLDDNKCFLLNDIYVELMASNALIVQCQNNPHTRAITERTVTQCLKTMSIICDFLK